MALRGAEKAGFIKLGPGEIDKIGNALDAKREAYVTEAIKMLDKEQRVEELRRLQAALELANDVEIMRVLGELLRLRDRLAVDGAQRAWFRP